MAILYRVADWDELFENAGSRKVENLRWVPIPNKHDSDGYIQLVDHPNGAAHYGCWVVILQVASKCKPRGTLVGNNGNPYDLATLARKTKLPQEMFEEALPRLLSPGVGWLEVVAESEDTATPLASHQPATSQLPASYQRAGAEHKEHKEGKGREGKEGKGKENKNHGVDGMVSAKKLLTNVTDAQLRDDAEMAGLYKKAVRLGILPDSEQGQLRFWGAACHALRVGENPPALFSTIVHKGFWTYITAEDEDRARKRIKGKPRKMKK